jgi:hypothetical protein
MIVLFERLLPKHEIIIKSTTSIPHVQQVSTADHFTGVPKLKGVLPTARVGSLAAGVAYLITKFIT